jgi:hypothetical protein
MTTLSLDSATTTGVAVVRGAELLHVSVHRAPTLAQIVRLVDDLASYRIDRIAIEKLVIRDGNTVADRGKRQTTVAQAKAVGVWEQAIRERFPGVAIEHVHPSTWRAWISMPERNTANRKRLKVISLHLAAQRWPAFPWTSDDASDAALLGLAVETRPR